VRCFQEKRRIAVVVLLVGPHGGLVARVAAGGLVLAEQLLPASQLRSSLTVKVTGKHLVCHLVEEVEKVSLVVEAGEGVVVGVEEEGVRGGRKGWRAAGVSFREALAVLAHSK
jgi:hypothetical protein